MDTRCSDTPTFFFKNTDTGIHKRFTLFWTEMLRGKEGMLYEQHRLVVRILWFIYRFPVVTSSFDANSYVIGPVYGQSIGYAVNFFVQLKNWSHCHAEVVLFSGIFVMSCKSMLFYKESVWTCTSHFGFPTMLIQEEHLSSDLGLFHEAIFWSLIAPSSVLGIYLSLLNSSAGLLLLDLKGKNCLTNF
jgi:hypothetical protein